MQDKLFFQMLNQNIFYILFEITLAKIFLFIYKFSVRSKFINLYLAEDKTSSFYISTPDKSYL